jgi:type I restriction-modification system DNA methylase subunit
MPLFHPKVIKKITEAPIPVPEEHAEILKTWAQSIEDLTIYKQKETSLHGTFKDKIVTQILGYHPFSSGAKNYDVFPEFPLAGNRVDLALGVFNPNDESAAQCVAPFELKGAKTKLDSIMAGRNKTPVQQAWEYAMDAKGARWVLVSNYLEIRLYAVGYGRQDYELFDLRTLYEPKNYTRFMALLAKDNLLGTATLSLLDQSAKQDKDITNKLYQDYKILRYNLIGNIRGHNPAIEQAPAVSCAQTILDRILFIAFAEDKDLLPANSLKQAFEHKDPYTPRPVWETYKALFRSINEGNPSLKIPKYNGGLFSDDPEINALNLPDSIFEGFKKLGDYDFDTEVSVNILGHIFEQSISDIEALQKGLSDLSIKTKDGKRKKEGVVYTPPFITRYIVEETLGGYLNRKREELENTHAEWFLKTGERKGEFKTEKAELDFWNAWQEILKSIKVVDPACGSGAFLVAAFDYLHDEYTRVNDRMTELRGGKSDLFDPDREILVNNLYGVDLNSESIEITKLSLWLKTAKRGKILNSLDANFRWGDSLIEDSNFSARAFTWKDAFPDIFAGGGFDVVLGNPPYVRQEFISHLKPYLEKRFEVYNGTIDLYAYFFELGLRILKTQGRMGYICSSTFFKTGSGQSLRAYLQREAKLNVVIDFGDLQVFEGVTTYPAIIVLTKGNATDNTGFCYRYIKEMPSNLTQAIQLEHAKLKQAALSNDSWQMEDESLSTLRTELTTGHKTLKEVYGSPYRGILTGLNEAFVIDGTTRARLIKEDPKSAELIKPFLEGKDLQKWRVESRDIYLILIPRGFTKAKVACETEDEAWKWFEKEYPSLAQHLSVYKTAAQKRCDKGDYWWELRACAYYEEFEKPKIIYPDMSQGPKFLLDDKGHFFANTSYFIQSADAILLGLLNSSTIWFYLRGVCDALRGGEWRLRLFSINIETIPIPKATKEQKSVIGDLAARCQKAAEERYEIQSRVRSRLADLAPKSWDGKLGTTLSDWWKLDFKDFQKAVKKTFKHDIPVFERDQWETHLTAERKKVEALTHQIAALERDINTHVYALFSLTPEEIKLIEGNV